MRSPVMIMIDNNYRVEGGWNLFLFLTIARGRIRGGVSHVIFDITIMLMNIKNFGRIINFIKFYHNLMEYCNTSI